LGGAAPFTILVKGAGFREQIHHSGGLHASFEPFSVKVEPAPGASPPATHSLLRNEWGTTVPGMGHVRLPWSYSPFPTFSFPTIWLTSWLFSLQKYSMISVFTIKGECPNSVKGRV
jgi:hypothetical protein